MLGKPALTLLQTPFSVPLAPSQRCWDFPHGHHRNKKPWLPRLVSFGALACQTCPDVFLSEPGQASLGPSKVVRSSHNSLLLCDGMPFFYMEISSSQSPVFQHSQHWASENLLYDLMNQSQSIHILLGYSHFFSSSGQEKAEEGDRSWPAHPSYSEEGCTYGKGTATWGAFNSLSSPLPQLLLLTTVPFVAHEHHENGSAKGREKGTFTPCACISGGEHCSC